MNFTNAIEANILSKQFKKTNNLNEFFCDENLKLNGFQYNKDS